LQQQEQLMLDIMVKVLFFHSSIFFKKKLTLKLIGMYFSSSLFYSSKYTKDCPEGKPFIICMVTPGNVYPGLLLFYSSFVFCFSNGK